MGKEIYKESVDLSVFLLKIIVIAYVINKLLEYFFNGSGFRALFLIALSAIFIYIIDNDIRKEINFRINKINKMRN